MNPTDIVIKTEKGREEISTRGNGLSSRLRQMLIIIDGTLSVAEITRRHPDAEECLALLQELLAQGLIALESGEPGGGPSRASLALSPEARSASESERLELAKRYLCDLVKGIVGPGSDNVIDRIRASSDRSELYTIVQSCYKVVSNVAGQRKADQFMAELNGILGEE